MSLSSRHVCAVLLVVGLSCGAPGGPDGGSGGGSSSTGGGSVGGGSADSGTGGGLVDGGMADAGSLALGASCVGASECGSGFCVDGVCCESACDGACHVCGAGGTCGAEPDGTECRAAVGTCDIAETCSSGACPANRFKDATVECRASGGVCDVAELCSGASGECPADVLLSGTTCHASAGPCDRAEVCSGASAVCPTDELTDAGVVCRAAVGVCDVPEVCSGSSAVCPTDAKFSSQRLCRDAMGDCDEPEYCDGTSDTCRADEFKSSATVCRSSAGVCDLEETCPGNGVNCPADVLKSATTECRAAAGLCDVAELCNGSSTSCGSDQKRAQGYVCRTAAGLCDVEDLCDGTADSCPDRLVMNGTQVSGCAYLCSGTVAACPSACATDFQCPMGSFCGGDGGCIAAKRAFVSSAALKGNATYFGFDTPCFQDAQSRQWRGAFRAWISDSINSVLNRNPQSNLPVLLPSGVKIADNTADLYDGTLDAPWNQFIDGGIVTSQQVWTGTNINAIHLTPTCNNWTSADAGTLGRVGTVGLVDGGWTTSGTAPCDVARRVYCLEM